MAETTNWERELAKLAPEARAKVEAALKAGLESELAAEAVSPSARRAEFSRGWFFSRAKADPLVHEDLAARSMSMDDESFAKFAKRLTELKSLRDAPPK